MTPDLRRLFNLDRCVAVPDAPGPGCGGCVFIAMHGSVRDRFYSLNLQVGDGGWQSAVYFNSRDDAELALEILALHCGAEVMR